MMDTEVSKKGHGSGDYKSRIGPLRVAHVCQRLPSAEDGSQAGDKGLRAGAYGSLVDDDDCGSSAYIYARSHLCACAIHLFLSTMDLGLIRRLYIDYPIPTNKFKKIA